MYPNSPVLLYAAVFAAAVTFVVGTYLVLSGGGDKAVSERLSGRRTKQIAGDPLRRRSLGAGKSPWLASILDSVSLRAFDDLVSTSGIRTSTERVLLFMALGTAAIFEGLDLLGGYGLFASAVGSLAFGIALPLGLIVRTRKRRLARITQQLPEAIDMLVRSMRAGHPIATGVGLVAREMQDPIGMEFGRTFDEMSFGLDLRQACEKMGQRLRIEEMDYMIAAMRIQSSTGGNLAEVLSSLSNVMREKRKLKAKVRALSAEARFSGVILSGLPVVVVSGLILLNPHYYDLAATSNSLKAILAFAVVLMCGGVLLVRKFVSIRI